MSDQPPSDPVAALTRAPIVEPDIDPELQSSLILTKVDWVKDWGRRHALWPMAFGLACCAMEMMATAATKYDLDRFGAGVFRASPRQADLMIVAGTLSHKMAPRVRRLWEQMPHPKYVIAMGACVIGGGPYSKFGYHVVQGVDLIVPVDIYVPGCPPRPEALIDSMMKLQERIRLQGGSSITSLPGGETKDPHSQKVSASPLEASTT